MGTVVKSTRGKRGDLSRRPLNQHLKDIPGQGNSTCQDLGAARI